MPFDYAQDKPFDCVSSTSVGRQDKSFELYFFTQTGMIDTFAWFQFEIA